MGEGYVETENTSDSGGLFDTIFSGITGLLSGETFTAGRDKARAETERKKLVAEDKRRFGVNAAMQRRETNLGGLQLLQQGREKAEMQSRMRRFAKKL